MTRWWTANTTLCRSSNARAPARGNPAAPEGTSFGRGREIGARFSFSRLNLSLRLCSSSHFWRTDVVGATNDRTRRLRDDEVITSGKTEGACDGHDRSPGG